jgi:hypothetical protein
MKARISRGWILGMVFAGGVMASGFARDGVNASPATSSLQQTGPASVPVTPAPSVVPATSIQAAPGSSPAAPAVPDAAADKRLAPNTHVSPWLYEIERLSQARVDEGVVLSYVANSAGTFNLTADQIIHLKNEGVSSQVINAMMQHDRELISGQRPLTASTPPPLPPAVQAAVAANLHTAGNAPTPPATAAAPAPAPAESQVVANDDSRSSADWVLVEPDDVPEQPRSAYPVRAPYPVKLNDPIVIWKLPTFTVPYW